jgi:hypothetical protein
MKKSSAPAPTTEPEMSNQSLSQPDLEFPIAPEFVSRPPHLDPQVMLRRCFKTMEWRNSRPGTQERRAAEKISAEFVL